MFIITSVDEKLLLEVLLNPLSAGEDPDSGETTESHVVPKVLVELKESLLISSS